MGGPSDAQGGDDAAERDEPTRDEAPGESGGDASVEAGDDVSTTEDVDTGEEWTEATDVEALRRRVEEQYDFENFGPADMAEMSAEEWEVAFDPETWITGEELLDRVEADLKQRVADRDVFARVERFDDRVVAYSDTGFATVYADGTVEGRGTVLRDVKPTVALCSMESYDVPADPPADLLPEPQEVPEGSGDLGNLMLQVVAGFQVLAGVVLVGAWLLISTRLVPPPGGGSVRSLNVVGMLVAGLGFLVVGLLLFAVVANARLSDRFRAEEYRNRLRAVDLDPGDRPDFLPDERGSGTSGGDDGASGAGDGAIEARGGGTGGDGTTDVDGPSETRGVGDGADESVPGQRASDGDRPEGRGADGADPRAGGGRADGSGDGR